MEDRIVRIVDGYWRISTPDTDISAEEAANLKSYLDEIRYPYEVDQYGIAIHGSMLWTEIEEGLLHFYDGVADVIPF
jgi:hypothetical protein